MEFYAAVPLIFTGVLVFLGVGFIMFDTFRQRALDHLLRERQVKSISAVEADLEKRMASLREAVLDLERSAERLKHLQPPRG